VQDEAVAEAVVQLQTVRLSRSALERGAAVEAAVLERGSLREALL
jgi:hypothetical protein